VHGQHKAALPKGISEMTPPLLHIRNLRRRCGPAAHPSCAGGADVSTDTTAYMMLATCNTQGELTALERGLHALHSSMDIRSYAESIGRKRSVVGNELCAAKVAEACPDIWTKIASHFSQLVEIHAAPAWLWPALVDAMLPSTRPMGEVLVDLGVPRVAEERWRTDKPRSRVMAVVGAGPPMSAPFTVGLVVRIPFAPAQSLVRTFPSGSGRRNPPINGVKVGLAHAVLPPAVLS
jgi:hypothetical protein